MKDENKYFELIIKELSGDISPAEKAALNALNAENAAQEKKLGILKKFWKHYFPKAQPNHIIDKTEKKLGFIYRNRAKQRIEFATKIAASLFIVAALVFFGHHYFTSQNHEILNQYSSDNGAVKEIVLSDGTRVWLNAYSYLFTSEPFTGENRVVSLIGEAYFEVAHNPDQPFIVKSEGLITKVLGTHFNVSSYPGDKELEVTLYEGKVNVEPENGETENFSLSPGEKITYTVDSGNMEISKFSTGKPALWRDGYLYFYDEDLTSIAKILERKFKKRIFISDTKIANLHFTANFEEEPLEKILDLLAKAHPFVYEKTDNGIIIKSKNKKQ